MTNILWLASWYPSRLNSFNGDFIERHAKAVSKYVHLTVLVILKDESLGFNEVEINKTVTENLTVYMVFYGKTTAPLWLESLLSIKKYFHLQKKLFTQIVKENGRPNLVHVHVAMKAGLLALFLKIKYNIPFVITEHWTGYYPQSNPSIYQNNIIFKKLNKAILRKAALFLPVSNHLGQTVDRYFTSVNFQSIPNVVDTSLFFYDKAIKLAAFRFIHPSLMNYQKNVEGILKAFFLLKEKGYEFEVLMLGNQDPSLLKLAADYGLLNKVIFFKPAVSYAAVAYEMQHSSALILFSRFENLPCVLLEGLCTGLPVISSKVGGVDEVINETNGLLVSNENIEQLVNAMQQIMDNYKRYNKELIAVSAGKTFNYDKVASQYILVYKTVLSQIEMA